VGIVGLGAGRPWAAAGLVAGAALALAARRRAAGWLPARRAVLLVACLAGAATTASGVGATIVLGRSLAIEQAPGMLAVFGLGARRRVARDGAVSRRGCRRAGDVRARRRRGNARRGRRRRGRSDPRRPQRVAPSQRASCSA